MLFVKTLFIALTALEPFHRVLDSHGIKVEAQKIDGSHFENLRASAHSSASVEALDAAVWNRAPERKENWGDGVTVREILVNKPDERVYYEVVHTPVVSDRDYVIALKHRYDPQTHVSQVSFHTTSDPSHPEKSSIVRIPRIEGECTIEPAEGGGTDISYVLFSEPGGSLPAFVAKSAQRDSTVNWLRDMLKRAGDPRL